MQLKTLPSKPILVLSGATASGKTGLALELARNSTLKNRIEIINADSIVIYRKLNIGSAKPTPQELAEIPHHLVDIRYPNEDYSAAEFIKDCSFCIGNILENGSIPIIVGGTGFYLKALFFGMWEAPPTQHAFRESLEKNTTQELYQKLLKIYNKPPSKIHANDRYRIIRALEIFETSGKLVQELEYSKTNLSPNPSFQFVLIKRTEKELESLIRTRTRKMLSDGLLNETRELIKEFPHIPKSLQSVGYYQAIQHLSGIPPAGRKYSFTMEDLENEIVLATRQLVKKQNTWFNRFSQSVPTVELNLSELKLEQAVQELLNILK